MAAKTAVPGFSTALISALKPQSKPYDLSDKAVRGLLLRVWVNGSKSWLFRYKWNGGSTRISLGQFPDIGLAKAREIALENRKWLQRGVDPRQAARDNVSPKTPKQLSKPAQSDAVQVSAVVASDLASKAKQIEKPGPEDKTSVYYLAYEYVEHYVKVFRKKSVREVVRILKKDVLSIWKTRDARTISSAEIIGLLNGIVKRSAPVMANRTADIVAQMWKYGIHAGIVENSPVNLLFSPGGKEKSRKRVFSDDELVAFVHGLKSVCTSKRRRHTLMVLLLLMQRRGELGLAEWTEFNFEKKEWHIPDEHAKMGRGHIVPLTDWAIEELLELKNLSKDSRFVLPSNKGDRAARPQLITRSVKRLRPRFKEIGIAPFWVHDLRRTGRTGLGRLGVLKEIAERVLNHAKEKIEGTYDLHEYLDEKRAALEKWDHRLKQILAMPMEVAEFIEKQKEKQRAAAAKRVASRAARCNSRSKAQTPSSSPLANLSCLAVRTSAEL